MGMSAVGKFVWAIAEGRVPMRAGARSPEMPSHEGAYLLNTTDQDAHVRVVIYFSDREPTGPYRLVVPARRTRQMRFDALAAPEAIPQGTDYSTVIWSDVPIVVQQTRLDLRQAEGAEPSTAGCSIGSSVAYSQ
jgi:hypothetical protein